MGSCKSGLGIPRGTTPEIVTTPQGQGRKDPCSRKGAVRVVFLLWVVRIIGEEENGAYFQKHTYFKILVDGYFRIRVPLEELSLVEFGWEEGECE